MHDSAEPDPCYHAKQEGTQFPAPKKWAKKRPSFQVLQVDPDLGPPLCSEKGPKTVYPNSGGTYFGGSKVTLKSGP